MVSESSRGQTGGRRWGTGMLAPVLFILHSTSDPRHVLISFPAGPGRFPLAGEGVRQAGRRIAADFPDPAGSTGCGISSCVVGRRVICRHRRQSRFR